MTQGHELRWGNDGRRGGKGWRGIRERQKWDNCNNIINKIYLKKKKEFKRNEEFKKPLGQHKV